MLILNSSNVIPLHTVLAFSNVTEVEDYFGIASPEAAEATTFFSSPPTPKSKLMYARFHLDGGRARVFGAPTFNARMLSQIQEIKGTLSFRSQGCSWGPVAIDLSSVPPHAPASRRTTAMIKLPRFCERRSTPLSRPSRPSWARSLHIRQLTSGLSRAASLTSRRSRAARCRSAAG
jgi:hypothetical protein